MRYAGTALCLAALAIIAWGCPQTGMESGTGETKLLKKFINEGDTQKATILFVKSRGCGADSAVLWDFLKSYATLSDGMVKAIAADADDDRDLKKAYGFATYPVTMLFDEKGDYVTEWTGTRFEPEEVKKKLIEMGMKIRDKDDPPPVESPSEEEEKKPVEEKKPAEEKQPGEGEEGEGGAEPEGDDE